VLAGMHDHFGDIVMFCYFATHSRCFDKLGSCPDNGEEFHAYIPVSHVFCCLPNTNLVNANNAA